MSEGGGDDHAAVVNRALKDPGAAHCPHGVGATVGDLDEQRQALQQDAAADDEPSSFPAFRSVAPPRSGLSGWESDGNISETIEGGGDRFDQVRTELSEIIMQQVQRLARMLQDENAKLKKQIDAMPWIICAQLQEVSSLQDDAELSGRASGAAASTASEIEASCSTQGRGKIQDLQLVCGSQHLSEGGGSSDDAEQHAPNYDCDRSSLRTPAPTPPSLQCRQKMCALRVVGQQRQLQQPRGQRDVQRGGRVSPRTQDSQRVGALPLPHQPDGAARSSELGPDGAPVHQDAVWEERSSNFSGISMNPGMIQNLRDLDDLLTNSLFESHGLMGPSRPSFGSRPSPNERRSGLEQAGSTLKAFFWSGQKPGESSSSSAAPSGAVPKAGGRRSPDLAVAAAVAPTPPEDFLSVHPPSYVPSAFEDSTEPEHSPEPLELPACDPRHAVKANSTSSSTVPGGWVASRFVSRISSAVTPTASGMDRLRVERESGLIANHACGAQGSYLNSAQATAAWEEARRKNGHPLASLVLAAAGITPIGTGRGCWLYGNVVLIGLALLLTGIAMCGTEFADKGSLYFYMSAGCISSCGLVGMLSLRFQQMQDLLGPRRRPLEFYACAFGFWDAWRRTSRRCFAVVVALWTCSTLSHMAMNLHFQCPQAGDSSFATCAMSFTVIGLICATLYGKLHICSGLELAIDHYCIRVFEQRDMSNSIMEWNVLQAMLRRAAHVVETSFIAVSTGILGVVVLTGVEFLKLFGADRSDWLTVHEGACVGLWITWLAPLVVLVFYFVFRAAAITEKCNRVPALVNSWMTTDRNIDLEKQYVVQYIMHSAAGYYVMGARLNATWALKLSYVFGVLLFSCLTQSVHKGT